MRRRMRRNAPSKKMNAGLKKYQRLVQRAKTAGVSTAGGSEAIERRLDEQKRRKSNKRRSSRAASARRKVVRKRAMRAKRRPAAAAPLKSRLKAFKAKKRATERAAAKRKAVSIRVRKARQKVTLSMLERQRRSLDNQSKRLTVRIDKERDKLARKNPGGDAVKTGLGVIGGYVVEQALAGGVRKLVKPQSAMMVNAVEYAVPAVGIAATHFLGAKIGLSQQNRMGVIAGMIGGALARNIGALNNLVSKVPGLSHLANLGKDAGLGLYYAGAAGMGRYVTDGSLGNIDLADDLYAGQAGMGRYMLDDTANFGMGMMPELHAGAAGVGEYIQEPAALDGFGGAHDDDMDELMDDLGSVPVLTPDEEQAENILIPELAYEAMQGLGQAASPRQTFRARSRLPLIRTTPGMAAKVQQARIGEIIGESQQVPGTVLVASSVAGRDINQSGGAFVPTQRSAFKNPGIKPAGNISVSPHGVFSRGIFSSTLPVHGQISR